MNKVKLISILSILLIFVLGTFVILFNSSYAIEDNENEKVIGEVIKLENFAKTYKENNNTDLSINELSMQYILRHGYEGDFWKSFIGTKDTSFIDFVNSNGGVNLDNDTILIDLNTYKEIDFTKMISILDSYYRNNDTTKLYGIYDISTHYSGILYDLIKYSDSIYDYSINNNITSDKDLIDYSYTIIGTNKDTVLNGINMYSDIDAYNIYKSMDFNELSLSDALNNYYIDMNTICSIKNRNSCIREELTKDKINSLLNNDIIGNKILSTKYDSLSTSNIFSIVTTSFDNYLDNKTYIELVSTSSNNVVGDEVSVKLYESNLVDYKIKHSNNICDVDILNDIMYIDVNNAGTDIITITSEDGASVEYTLNATNVAPSITKELDAEYEFFYDNESTIKIEANGTNNTYTWLSSEKIDGEYKEISETVVPYYTFEPTKDMNNTYIKCRIENVGNDSVESNPTLIRLRNISVVESVETGDNSLMLAFAIIFFVISSNVFVLTLRKTQII